MPSLIILLSTLLVVGGLRLPSPEPDAGALHKAKLGFSFMNAAQEQELWRRADAYALAEAFLKACGAPSYVERRMRIAADPCIEKAALDRVAAYFRKKVVEFGRTKAFACETPHAKELVRTVRTRIDRDVEEVRTMCRNCFFC